MYADRTGRVGGIVKVRKTTSFPLNNLQTLSRNAYKGYYRTTDRTVRFLADK